MVVSTHLKNTSQIGSFPQVGVKIKNIWNHHPDKQWKTKTGKTPKPCENPWFCVLFSCYFCFCHVLCLVCSGFWFKRKACSNQPKWSKSRLAPDAMDCNAGNGMLYAWSQPHCHVMMFSVIFYCKWFYFGSFTYCKFVHLQHFAVAMVGLARKAKKREKRRLLTGYLRR